MARKRKWVSRFSVSTLTLLHAVVAVLQELPVLPSEGVSTGILYSSNAGPTRTTLGKEFLQHACEGCFIGVNTTRLCCCLHHEVAAAPQDGWLEHAQHGRSKPGRPVTTLIVTARHSQDSTNQQPPTSNSLLQRNTRPSGTIVRH